MKADQNKLELIPLFPHVVAKTNIGRRFTEEEYACVSGKYQSVSRGSNAQSIDTSVLENQELSGIKEFCMLSVNKYWKDVLSAVETVTPAMTQSWVNYTNKGEYHQGHVHPNSFISGVFYFSVDEDSIEFDNPVMPQITVNVNESHPFNFNSYSLNVEDGDCVIFPSYLRHGVSITKKQHTRISIAFNIFPQGVLGIPENLTGLEVEVK